MDTVEVTTRGPVKAKNDQYEAHDWDVDALGNLTLKGAVEGPSGKRKSVATYLTGTWLKVERK